jgi:hypothetical protein
MGNVRVRSCFGAALPVTASFHEAGDKIRLTYRMVFDTAAVCVQLRTFALKANEENFDRLAVELERMAQA